MRRTLESIAVVMLSLFSLGLQAGSSRVSFQKAEGRIDVLVEGKPFTSYYFSPDLPRPFFHPLRTADGKVVTRGFPMVPDAQGRRRTRTTRTTGLAGSPLGMWMVWITGEKPPKYRAGLFT